MSAIIGTAVEGNLAGAAVSSPANITDVVNSFQSDGATNVITWQNIAIWLGARAAVDLANVKLATLESGVVPPSQMGFTAFLFKGDWNPATNTPTLADGDSAQNHVYRVTGSANPTARDLGSGSINFSDDEYVAHTGSAWVNLGTGAIIPITRGGTGATTAAGARTNLGVLPVQGVDDRVNNRAPGNGYEFDGTDDYLSIPHAAGQDLGSAQDFTVLIRGFLPAVPSAEDTIVTSRLGGSSVGFQIRQLATGKLQGRLVGAGATASPSDNADVVAGEFSYAISCDRSADMVRYLNGVQDGAATDISTVGDLDDTSDIHIGRLNSAYWAGRLYEVVIIKRAMTAAEIALWHARGGVAISDQWANIILSLQGRNVESDSWQDESSSEFHATVNGASRLFSPLAGQIGNWTPSLTFGNNAVGQTGTFVGEWVKVNEHIWEIDGRITLTAKGSSTGAARIAGLPVTPYAYGGDYQQLLKVTISNAAAGLTAQPYGNVKGGSAIDLEEQDSGGINVLDDTAFNNTSQIRISGRLRVA